MLRALTKEETDILDARRAELYQSKWTIDNLTAVLVDADKGGSGLHESTARAKAHSILEWLRLIVHVEIPERHE